MWTAMLILTTQNPWKHQKP